MGAKVVVAITPDRALGKVLRAAMTAAGAEVNVVDSARQLPRGRIAASLVVVHQPVPDVSVIADVAARLPHDGHVIPLLPRGDLPAAVAAMKCHDRVAGVLGADSVRGEEVSAMAKRLLFGDLFGLAKVLPWGARIHSLQVGTKDEKTAAIDEVSRFATAIGVRRKYREAIQQCCDEMLMNALYDAPVGADGVPYSQTMGIRGRPVLVGDDRATIEYGCDGRRFAVSVRDHFGRFERKTLVEYLDKCLHSQQQIDRKPGGAGLGLYLMSNSATTLMFNVQPGIATECVCTFDIDATKLTLEQLGVYRESAGPAGQAERTMRVARPTAPPQSIGRGLVLALASACLVLIAISAVIGVPRLYRHFNPPASAQAPVDSPSQTEVDLPATPRTPTASGGGEEAVVPPAGSGTLTVHSNIAAEVAVAQVGAVPGSAGACEDTTLPLDGCPLPDGAYHVVLRGDEPYVDHSFDVEVKGAPVMQEITFGLIEAKAGYSVAPGATGDQAFRRIAVPGERGEVWIVDEQRGKRTRLEVPVHPGQTVLVP